MRSRAALCLRAGDAAGWSSACAQLAANASSGDDSLAVTMAIDEIRTVALEHPAARAQLCGSTALATVLAGALRPLCERTCLGDDGHAAEPDDAAEAVLWLLGWLLPTPQNAAVLHVRVVCVGLLLLHFTSYKPLPGNGHRRRSLIAIPGRTCDPNPTKKLPRPRAPPRKYEAPPHPVS